MCSMAAGRTWHLPTWVGQTRGAAKLGGTDRASRIRTRSARGECDPGGVEVGSSDRGRERKCGPPILPLVTGEADPKDPFNSV